MSSDLFQYFMTAKNLSKNNLEDISYIFNKNFYVKQSILELFISEINSYIEKHKVKISEINKDNVLKILSDYYDKYLINTFNPKLFFTYFMSYKSLLTLNIENINNLKKLFEKITIQNVKKYNENLYYNNPLNYQYLNEINNNKSIDIHSLTNKVNTVINILTQGNRINLSLPTIGIIYSADTNKNIKTITGFMSKLVNMKSNENITEHISLKSLNLGTTLTDILFKIKNYNEKNPIRTSFKNTIDNININLVDLLTVKIDNKLSKNSRKIKSEYIIPYKINTKKNINDIIQFDKNDYDKYRKISDLFDKNNAIVNYVLTHIKSNSLDKKNHKNVLACYLFYIIKLTFDIYNAYIDKIDDFLREIIESRNKAFIDLNIKEAFEYTSLLKTSTYKLKLILLNNFYNLFLPTQILQGSYGMKLNDYGCYIAESILIGDNQIIINDYPFIINSNSKIKGDKVKLQKFILNILYDYDIYDKTNILEIGGKINDFDLMKQTLQILLNYYKNMEIINSFNLFIVDLLYKNWKVDNIVPYEIISDVISLNKMNTSLFTNSILLKYEESIDKCVYYINIILDIRKRQKENVNDINLKNLENINMLCYIFYNMKCLAIISYVKNSFININLKNKLLEELLFKKNKYEKFLSK